MSTELWKTANQTVSFIAELMTGQADDDGKPYPDKLVIVLVKRTSEHKAVQTLRYFLDIPVAKVLCHDLFHSELRTEHSEYKRTGDKERAFKIKPTDDNSGYRFNVGYREKGGEWEYLFFDLSAFQARQLAITILDYLRAHELAVAIKRVVMSPIENGTEDNS